MEAALQDKVCPRVGVEFRNEACNYTIYVHNNGATINKERKDRIFEAGVTDKNSPGRGYGLYIAKTLVDRYGGEIECRTDKKTSFVIRFPNKEAEHDLCNFQ
jgi:sensor histidine kinase regulating citrate/malate metabolism